MDNTYWREGFYQLQRLTIPSIGEWFFYGRSGFTGIVSNAIVPPTLFIGMDTSIPLHVSMNSFAAYRNAIGWSDFTNIIFEGTPSGICGAEGDGLNLTWTLDTETGVLTISGTGVMTDYVWQF